ncbi:MAG: CCA tRNA nucleotidyltransferase [Bacteroidia bacterium]|nr:CCA tRNA nucleotidyltransferase [Bacteroidia bacterium]MCF8425968.1 CCA tRNA nucleotidyltransferase [Bacteroidia bacterium]
MKIQLKDPIFLKLQSVAKNLNTPIFVIGGFVRDLFLKRESKDIDIVVVGDGIEFAQAFAELIPEKTDFAVFKNFGTAMVKTKQWEIEFVGARKESYSKESRKPAVIPGTIKDDQLRRDFTINALAISLNEGNLFELVDPFGGVIDIENKVIKTPLEPSITFDDDPLRMMRAIRFAAQLNFAIEYNTFEAIKKQASRISIVSMERITEELNKIMQSKKPSIGLNLLFDSGLLAHVFPELQAMHGVEVIKKKAHKDNFYHTLQVVDNVCLETNNLWLRWATMLHDIGKPSTKKFLDSEGWTFHGHEDRGSRMVSKIFRRMKLPLNEKMKYVEKLVAMHHRPKALAEDGITDSAIRRLIVDAGEDLEDLFTLCRADMTSRFPEKIKYYRANLLKVQELVKEVEERDALRNWQPPISGEEIMAHFNLTPCREVGLIKLELREAILEGDIPNTKEAAFQKMIEIGTRVLERG